MSFLHEIAFGDVPTWGLLIGAGVTALFAKRALDKQSQELSELKKEVKDGQTLVEQQSKLIEIQSGQLEEQRKLTSEQIRVLELQRRDLEESLAKSEREAEERDSAQASMVTTWFGEKQVSLTANFSGAPTITNMGWGAYVLNASHLPIFQVRVFFHYVQDQGADWTEANRGGPPEWIRVIPPHGDRWVEIPDTIRNMINECNDQVYVTSVEFTDASGQRWQRDPRAALNRIGS